MKKSLAFFLLALLTLGSCAVDRAHGTLAKSGTYAPHDPRTRDAEPYAPSVLPSAQRAQPASQRQAVVLEENK